MSKRAEEAALKAYPIVRTYNDYVGDYDDTNFVQRIAYEEGYMCAEKDFGWHSVEESLPPVDEEVIVLADRLNLGALFVISFGHIVDRVHCSDYNGWNIPGVKYWMPMPKIPKEDEK